MTTLEEFKKKQLEILHELDRVCGILGIHYYLAYGTCLGAVRHKGFIPWDDDIDVFLKCNEMDVLFENRALFKENYFLQSRETDLNYHNMKRALCDSTTAYFANEQDNKDINHGMSIDLYTLFPYPDNWFAAHKLIIDSYIMRMLYMDSKPRNHGKIGKIGYTILSKLYSGEKREQKIKKIENKLKYNGGKQYYSSFFGEDITPFSTFKFPVDCFEEPKRLLFEDYHAPCPTKPELICELTYGKNYMEFPPEEQRKPRHNVLFMSTTEPYTNYKGKYYLND